MRILIYLFLIISLNATELTVEQLFNIKTVEVKKSKLQEAKKFYGYSKIDESAISDVVLRVNGYIEDISVNRTFDYVKKGDELFKIYSSEIYLASSELLNSLDSSIPRLKKSFITKMRLLDVSKKEIDKIIDTKKIEEIMPFYSKSEGFIIEKTISNGSSVKAGKLLYKIADYKKMWVIAKIYESDIGFVEKGMSAKIRFDGSDKIYSSKVDFIYPDVKPNEKTISVRFLIDNKDLKIHPGSFAKVTIFDKKRTVLTLPKTAVIAKGNKHIVFVTGEYEGEYEPIFIKAKRVDARTYEVISGLKEGDSVVNKSLFLLDSDAQINGMY